MEPMTMLVGTLTTLVVKGAIQQHGPTDTDWGSAAGSVLSALLAAQAETDGTLRRVEEKLDKLAVDRYRHPLAAAVRHLRDAQEAWRLPEHRERLLEQARFRLTDAAVAAPDSSIRATVEWHLAIAWLLSGSVPDCWAALIRARHESFNALCSAARDWSEPSTHARRRPADTINALRRTQVGARLAPALDFLQKAPADEDDPHGAATSAIDTALGVTGTVQDIRSALGAPAASCQKPRIVPYPLPHRDDHSRIGLRPAMVVDLQTGTNDVWGTFIDVHEVREPRQVAEEWWTVDVNLTLTPAPDGGEMQVLSVARAEDLYREEDRLREAPMFSFTSDQSPPPDTRTVGPNGADAAAVRHGWVTSLCRGRPTMIGVRTRFELIDLNLAKMPRAGMIGLLPIHPRLASASQPAEHRQ